LRIAVIAPLVAPIGGAEPYGNHALLIDVARGLARRGHEVKLYAAAGSRVTGVDMRAFEVPASVSGAFIHADSPPDSRIAGMSLAFERVYARVRDDRPDVVSQHAFDAEAIELADTLPVLHTLHLPPIVPAVVAACRASGARCAAVSRQGQAEWRGAGVARVECLPNGVPDRAASTRSPQRIAVVAGRICREKGTAVGIRAGLAAGLDVAVVGAVYDRVYFAREVEPLLGPRAHFAHCVPRAALARKLAGSAVCVMPIDWPEPFGLLAAEAQVVGCPVVGYALGALPEIVEHGVSGLLVPAGDETQLVNAIGAALDLDRARVRESGRARLLLDGCIDRYEHTLQGLAGVGNGDG
jgi:glycosyltransferase involved in cell wall biosynthesis